MTDKSKISPEELVKMIKKAMKEHPERFERGKPTENWASPDGIKELIDNNIEVFKRLAKR